MSVDLMSPIHCLDINRIIRNVPNSYWPPLYTLFISLAQHMVSPSITSFFNFRTLLTIIDLNIATSFLSNPSFWHSFTLMLEHENLVSTSQFFLRIFHLLIPVLGSGRSLWQSRIIIYSSLCTLFYSTNLLISIIIFFIPNTSKWLELVSQMMPLHSSLRILNIHM